MGIPARPSRVARFLRGYCSIGGMGSQPVNPPKADGRAGMTDLLGGIKQFINQGVFLHAMINGPAFIEIALGWM